MNAINKAKVFFHPEKEVEVPEKMASNSIRWAYGTWEVHQIEKKTKVQA